MLAVVYMAVLGYWSYAAAISPSASSPAPAPSVHPTSPPAKSAVHWKSPQPVVVDVDDDGIADVIGTLHDPARDAEFLTALSGATGRPLWTMPVNTSSVRPPSLHLDQAHAQVLVDLSTGWRAYELATGDLSPKSPRDRAPDSTRLTAEGEDAPFEFPANHFSGLLVAHSFCPTPECASTHGLAWAKIPGSTSPTYLLGYARETGSERWRTPIVGVPRQPHAVLVGDSAVVSYVPKRGDEQRAIVQRISLIDGSVAWERSLLSERPVTGIVVVDETVVVTHADKLYVIELGTGETRWKFEG